MSIASTHLSEVVVTAVFEKQNSGAYIFEQSVIALIRFEISAGGASQLVVWEAAGSDLPGLPAAVPSVTGG